MSEIIVTSPERLRALIAEAVQPLPADPKPHDLRLYLDYLTTNQVAHLAGVNPNTVREWTNRGELLPARTGRAEKYHIDTVRAYLADRLQVAGVKMRERMTVKE